MDVQAAGFRYLRRLHQHRGSCHAIPRRITFERNSNRTHQIEQGDRRGEGDQPDPVAGRGQLFCRVIVEIRKHERGEYRGRHRPDLNKGANSHLPHAGRRHGFQRVIDEDDLVGSVTKRAAPAQTHREKIGEQREPGGPVERPAVDWLVVGIEHVGLTHARCRGVGLGDARYGEMSRDLRAEEGCLANACRVGVLGRGGLEVGRHASGLVAGCKCDAVVELDLACGDREQDRGDDLERDEHNSGIDEQGEAPAEKAGAVALCFHVRIR